MFGVFGGLFAGIFTPTEAGAVGAALALIIALVKRSLSWHGVQESLIETLVTSAALFIIAIGASMLTRFLASPAPGTRSADLVGGMEASTAVLLGGHRADLPGARHVPRARSAPCC